jgi:hypothetical protein
VEEEKKKIISIYKRRIIIITIMLGGIKVLEHMRIMSTEEFKEGISELLSLKKDNLAGFIVIMCAEALPWRCHRRLISDYLSARNFMVYNIIDKRLLSMLLMKFCREENRLQLLNNCNMKLKTIGAGKVKNDITIFSPFVVFSL